MKTAEHLSPIRISKTAWYYEEKVGIIAVVEERDNAGNLRAVTQTRISWPKLERSLRRSGRKVKP